MGVLLGGVVISGLVGVLIKRSDTGQTTRQRAPLLQGYEITSPTLVAGLGEEGTQTMEFTLAWRTTEFPGVYRCTFSAQDSSGSEVGSHSDVLVSLAPIRTDARVSISVAASATSASGFCDDERLDIGGDYAYDFSNLQVEPEPVGPSGVHAVRVSFDAEWLGDGYQGVVSCVRKFYDSGGSLVYVTTPFTFFDADGTSSNGSVVIAAEEFALGTPATVDMDCSPFQA
jgi:hypothetical protein